MKKGLVTLKHTPEARQMLIDRTQGRCEFSFWDKSWTQEQYHAALKESHIIIGEPTNDELACCENLELMQSGSSGANYYVQGGMFPKNATLCCMTGQYGNLIAEHMLGLMISLCRRIPEYRDQQHAHNWHILRYDKPVEDSTVLILGAGDIGTTLAKWLRPMAGRILGIRRSTGPFPDCYDEMGTLADLQQFLPQADFVLAVLPQTPETIGILDESRLRKMKKDAVLVNAGRGSLIDQEALVTLLEEGWFWGVGLDVAVPEPLPEEHPLWNYPRVMLTPHAAGNSYAPGSPLDRKIWAYAIENVSRYLDGQVPENQIDFRTGYRSHK